MSRPPKKKKEYTEARQISYKHRLCIRIMELVQACKNLGISKLQDCPEDHLIEIGKAAAQLNQAIKKAGVYNEDKIENKWRN